MRRGGELSAPKPAAGAARRIAGLYAITPHCDDDDALAAMADAALAGGAGVLQYRRGGGDRALFMRQGRRLAAVCRRRGALFIINNDAAAARRLGADGAHVGADDMPAAEARRLLGAGAIIGATCGGSMARALAAQAAGADYVAFGAFFASRTKPAAARCPPRLLAEAKRKLRVPVVAVGGITAANIGAVAGADAVAVCAGIFAAADITAAARLLSEKIALRSE